MQVYGEFSVLMTDVGGPPTPCGGRGAIPGQMALGGIRKQTEQAMRIKSVNSAAP